MSSQTDEIDLVCFCVVQDLAVWLAFTYCMFDLAPKVGFGWNDPLQPLRSLMIGRVFAERIPGYLWLADGAAR